MRPDSYFFSKAVFIVPVGIICHFIIGCLELHESIFELGFHADKSYHYTGGNNLCKFPVFSVEGYARLVHREILEWIGGLYSRDDSLK